MVQKNPESLTDEERYMFRKLGLRMKAFLLLARRGVFGGTVENMHLHWNYRELIKIIVKAPNIEEFVAQNSDCASHIYCIVSHDLLNHVSTLQIRVHQLTSELEQMAAVKEKGDEDLYNKLDLAYPTEDDSEDDEDGDFEDESDAESAEDFHAQPALCYV